MRARSEPVRAFSTKDEAVRFAGRQLGGDYAVYHKDRKFGPPRSESPRHTSAYSAVAEKPFGIGRARERSLEAARGTRLPGVLGALDSLRLHHSFCGGKQPLSLPPRHRGEMDRAAGARHGCCRSQLRLEKMKPRACAGASRRTFQRCLEKSTLGQPIVSANARRAIGNAFAGPQFWDFGPN
jgi:hypothetical protein